MLEKLIRLDKFVNLVNRTSVFCLQSHDTDPVAYQLTAPSRLVYNLVIFCRLVIRLSQP